MSPSTDVLAGDTIFPKLATTIEIEFYEPLNSIAMPTPILQVYSDYRENEVDVDGNPTSTRLIGKDYTQPTPTPQQVHEMVPMKDSSPGEADPSWKNVQALDPPTVSLLDTNENQSKVQLLVEYGNTSSPNWNSRNATPVIPSRIKIVVGFLENSYNRHV